MFTDATIEIKCNECGELAIGVKEMEEHINKKHSTQYSPLDAKFYAQDWCEHAHDAMEEFLRDYGEQRKLDQSIEADRAPNK